MPVLTNPRQERFALELAGGRPPAEAYRLAGYRPGNASRLRRHPARPEDVVGNAGGVKRGASRPGSGKRGAANRSAGSDARHTARRGIGDHVESTVQASDREIVRERLVEARCPELIISVVRNTALHLALDAADDPVVEMLSIVLTGAAFDVAPADIGYRPGHALRIDKRIAGDADRRG